MKRYLWIGILICFVMWCGSSLAMDCRLGADFYYRAKSQVDPQRMIEWLDRSVQVCPNFNAWYMLGLIYRQQGRIDSALDAFSRAAALAVSPKTEALALAGRGELLLLDGQLPRALQTLELAARFHPKPTPDWLENSLKNARIQLSRAIIPATDIAHILTAGKQTRVDGRFAIRPAVNLPVHFDFDRAVLNPAGARQVAELGRALASLPLNRRTFLLVGHTDKRGSRTYNQALSEKRASTVKLELERQFPSLSGRLETCGRGESELLYDGDTEIDHQLNRRVQVTIED